MAEKKIDVYKDWLKIEAANRPLNYYQILKLRPFEDDIATIRKHYRELNAYIRKYATGEFIEESQALLNEFAKAMLCLTDQERKAEYDFKLGRKTKESEGPRTLEDILLENKVVSPEQIKKAKSYAAAVGLDLQQAILQQKAAAPEDVMLAYAESIGLPFVNLDDIPVDEFYAPQMNPNTARQHSFVPVMADMGKLILASPSPVSLDVEDELRMTFEMPVRCAICTPTQVNAAIAKYYPRDAVQRIVARNDDGEAVPEAAAKPGKEKKTKKAKGPVAPLSAAAKKRRLLVSFMTFNFAAMVTAFGRYFTVKYPKAMDMIPWAIAVGAVAFGVAWYLNTKEVDEEE